MNSWESKGELGGAASPPRNHCSSMFPDNNELKLYLSNACIPSKFNSNGNITIRDTKIIA